MTTTYPFKFGFCDGNPQLAALNTLPQLYADAATLSPKLWRMMAAWNYIAKAADPGAAAFDAVNNVPTTKNRDWTTIDRCICDIMLTVGADILMIIGQGRPTYTTNSSGFFGWLLSFFGAHPSGGVTATDYGNFVGEVVARYKPGGPGIRTDGKYAPLAGRGVTRFEIWNEENNAVFWGANINATDYVAYLKAAYTAIKAQLPGTQSTVVFGGMQHTQRVGTYWSYGWGNEDEMTFLQQCYKAAGTGANALGHFYDVMAEHFYTQSDTVASPPAVSGTTVGPEPLTTTDNFQQLIGVHNIMNTNGDGAKKIWITECGFQTSTLTQAQQSSYMQEAFANFATLSYVDAVIIYNFRDGTVAASAQDSNTWGVEDGQGNKKAIWSWLTSWAPIVAVGTVAVGVTLGGGGIVSHGGNTSVAVSLTGTGTQHYPVAGTIAIPVVPAGTGVEHYSAAGTVSATVTPSGTGVNPSGSGTIPLTITPSGTGVEHYNPAGTVSIAVSPTGTGIANYPVSGTTTISPTPSGTGVGGYAASGAVSVTVTPAGTGTQNIAAGTVSIPVTPAGTGNQGATVTGAISVAVAPAGTGAERYPVSGTTSVAVTPTGTGVNPSGTGTTSVAVTLSGTGAEHYSRSGTTSVTVTPSGTGAERYPVSATTSVAVTPTGTGAEHYNPSGSISVAVTPSGTGVGNQGPVFSAAGSGGTAAFGNSATASCSETISVTTGDTIYSLVVVRSGGNWITTPTTNTITDSTGDTFTLLQSVAFNGASGQTTWWIHLFKCVTTHGGTHTLTSNYTAPGGTWVVGPLILQSVAYSNATTHANITTAGSLSTSSGALSITQTSATGHRALVVWSCNDTNYYSTFNQTGRANKQGSGTPTAFAMIGDAAGASSVTFSSTTATSVRAAISLDMSP